MVLAVEKCVWDVFRTLDSKVGHSGSDRCWDIHICTTQSKAWKNSAGRDGCMSCVAREETVILQISRTPSVPQIGFCLFFRAVEKEYLALQRVPSRLSNENNCQPASSIRAGSHNDPPGPASPATAKRRCRATAVKRQRQRRQGCSAWQCMPGKICGALNYVLSMAVV